MCKRLFLLAALLMITAPAMAIPVGIFDDFTDVKKAVDNPLGIGWTQYVATDKYLITGGGDDIWGNADAFQYAYSNVSGAVRIEAKLRWQDSGWNDWAKIGVMLRESLDAGSIHYSTDHRKGGGNPWAKRDTTGDNAVFGQWRGATGGGSGGHDWWGAYGSNTDDVKVGVQRSYFGPLEIIQHMLDKGAGWEVFRTHAAPDLMADDILVGLCLTSHDNAWLAQGYATEVAITEGVDPLIPIGVVPPDNKLDECGTDIPGFLIYTAKPGLDPPYPSDWNYIGMNELLDGLTSVSEAGTRIEEFVNLHDSSGRGNFGDDQSFPGIDPFEQPTADPAAGDNDDYFATQVTGCIELTAGQHIFCINSDDGAQMWIGGVFVGQTTEWKGASNEYIFVDVEEAGKYELIVRHLEGAGGAALELCEVMADGSLVLMNDVANGASPVYVPEPATIALLGFGGLAMLRIRKRS
jgi:hypothetical protein